MVVVAFQSVLRIAVTGLASRLTSANANRDMAARYATLVSFLLFYWTNNNDGTHAFPVIPGDSSTLLLHVCFICDATI